MMHRLGWPLAAFAAVSLGSLASCSKDEAECKDRLAKLQERFDTLPNGEFTPVSAVPSGVNLPEISSPKMIVDRGPVLHLGENLIEIEGFKAATLGELDAKLAEVEKVEEKLKYRNKAAYVAIDGDERVSVVMDAICAIAKRRKPYLMVAAPPAKKSQLSPVKPPEWLKEKILALSKATADQRTPIMAESMTRAIGRCETMGKWFEEIDKTPVERRPNALKVLVAKGAETCMCDVDVDALEMLTVMYVLDPGPSYMVAGPIDCTKGDREIELPAMSNVTVLAKLLGAAPGEGSIHIKGAAPPVEIPKGLTGKDGKAKKKKVAKKSGKKRRK